MSTWTLSPRIEMYGGVCSECGVFYVVPQWFDSARHDDGRTFYCPNGHRQHYTESTAEKLNKCRAVRDDLEEDLAATDRKLTRAKAKIKKLEGKQ